MKRVALLVAVLAVAFVMASGATAFASTGVSTTDPTVHATKLKVTVPAKVKAKKSFTYSVSVTPIEAATYFDVIVEIRTKKGWKWADLTGFYEFFQPDGTFSGSYKLPKKGKFRFEVSTVPLTTPTDIYKYGLVHSRAITVK